MDPSKLFSAGSHNYAKTFPLQAAELAWRESAVAYSLRSLGSLAKYDRDSFSWRTSQQLLFEEQSELLESFAAYGMTVDGVFYPLRMWERITGAKDGGFWATPNAADSVGSHGGGQGRSLRTDIYNWKRRRHIPTPTACDAKNNRRSSQHKPGSMHSVDLVDFVRMWPTPTSRDDRGPASNQLYLNRAVKMWPTPTTQDAKNNGAPSQMERNTKPLNAEVGGSLNPTWVEWLMGYPLEWTVLEDWATQWFRPKREKRLKG